MSLPTRFTPDSLIRVRRLGAFDISPVDRWAVVAIDELADDEKTYDTNLYRIELQRPQDGLVALTRNTRKKALPRFAPDGSLTFLAEPDPAARKPPRHAEEAKAAKELKLKDGEKPGMQVHRMRVDGGEPTCLTDLPGGVARFRWTKDGRRLVLLAPVDPEALDLAHDRELHASRKDRKTTGQLFPDYPLRYWDKFHGPRFPHLIVADADGSNARDLTPGLRLGLDESDFDLSPDGTLACVDFRTTDKDLRMERHLVLIDLATGERRALTSGEGGHWQPRFSPDGKRIACTYQLEQPRVHGKRNLKVVEVATGAAELPTERIDLWPDELAWLDDQRIAWTADSKGACILKLSTLGGGDETLSRAGHVSGVKASLDGRTVYFLLDRMDAPAELFSQVPSEAPRRLTSANAEMLAGHALVAGASHWFDGAENTRVQLWEVRPPDFDESRKYPLLVWIHGGPIGAFTDWFHFRWNPQIYASQGYVVIQVNPRGSTGFGQAFVEGNNGDWGNRCYLDIMAATEEWSKKPYVDSTRMAAMGASFGGYMVNWIAGQEAPFKCLVSHAGLYDLNAFWGTTDCGPEWEREFGVPWSDPELYRKWTPSQHAPKFKTPTLVIHGELDYRVPLGEGLAMYQALRKHGVPAKFLYFPDENHWILKPGNMKYWNEVVLDWLSEHLGPDHSRG